MFTRFYRAANGIPNGSLLPLYLYDEGRPRQNSINFLAEATSEGRAHHLT
jgi:hypothetical protein